MRPRPPLSALTASLLCLCLAACGTFGGGRKAPPPPPPAPQAGTPLEPEPQATVEVTEDDLRVRKVPDPIVVAAWAEPKQLPPGGGQAQILVRIQKRGGQRYPGVEVRLKTSTGSLYSKGQVLVTDSQGMTRDRLTTRRSAVITLNAGGTRYRFPVPVMEPTR